MKAVVTMSEKRQEHFAEEVQYEIGSLRRSMDRFQAEFTDDPASALRGSESVFREAAELELYTIVQKQLADAGTIQEIADWLLSDVLGRSRKGYRSTSAQANMMEDERLAARSKLLERLIGQVNYFAS